MSDLFGNHIVGFPTRRLIYQAPDLLSQFGKLNDLLDLNWQLEPFPL